MQPVTKFAASCPVAAPQCACDPSEAFCGAQTIKKTDNGRKSKPNVHTSSTSFPESASWKAARRIGDAPQTKCHLAAPF